MNNSTGTPVCEWRYEASSTELAKDTNYFCSRDAAFSLTEATYTPVNKCKQKHLHPELNAG